MRSGAGRQSGGGFQSKLSPQRLIAGPQGLVYIRQFISIQRRREIGGRRACSPGRGGRKAPAHARESRPFTVVQKQRFYL